MPEGANEWGVHDLVGNVWEWTGSQLKWYPGSNGDSSGITPGEYVIRGGSFVLKIKEGRLVSNNQVMDVTLRQWVKTNMTDERLGFRLVADAK
jgi:formylglycine-generating enzyme required for sulfatase activity